MELDSNEVVKKIEELKAELYNLRFANATGNLEKPSKIKEGNVVIALESSGIHTNGYALVRKIMKKYIIGLILFLSHFFMNSSLFGMQLG